MANAEIQKHDKLAEGAHNQFGEKLLDVDRSFDDLALVVDKSIVHDVLAWLRDTHKCDFLMDLAGIDLLELEEYKTRFELEYMLYSTTGDVRVRVRVPVPETDMDIPTATDLWQAANWAEREAWEMFGFNFAGHPCLKRLLTHHEFVGHPLRKDYPVMGGQWCSSPSDMTDELAEEQGGAPSD